MIHTAAGRVTIGNKKGLTVETILAALAEATAIMQTEVEPGTAGRDAV